MKAKPFQLKCEIDTTGFGDIGLRVGDLDNDGQQEVIFLQAKDSGIQGRIMAGGYYTEKHVHCITAMKLNGEIMWQHGEPLGTGYWTQHHIAAAVTDINDDGHTEVLYATERDGRSYLRMLDGQNGRFRKEVETGGNTIMQLVDMRGLGKRRDILVSTFVNPIYVYDDNLNCLWNCHYYGGAGHYHDFADVNGDGKEELFIGYCCVLASGRKLWWRPDLDAHLEDMARCPHCDYIFVKDIDNDGRLEEVMICGKDMVVPDAATGEDRWMYSGRHIQWAALGHFYPDIEGLQIYATDREVHSDMLTDNPPAIANRGYMLDGKGRELWRREKTGKAWTVRVDGQEGDCLLATPPLQSPVILDGRGNVIQELELPAEAYKGEPHTPQGLDDMGIHAKFTIADTDGDGRDEILAYNRTRLWHFVQG